MEYPDFERIYDRRAGSLEVFQGAVEMAEILD
jgi:hypothetical protein